MDHVEMLVGPRMTPESHAQHESPKDLPLAPSRSDPPGFDIPQVRQMEWWLYRHQIQDTYSTSKRRQLEREVQIPPPLSVPLPPVGPNVTPHDQKQSHSYKEYIRARRKKVGRDMDESDSETIFSWVPNVAPGTGNASPYRTPSNYRSLAAQEAFAAAVPKRSWSTENEHHNDDDPPTHSEQTVMTNFEDSSWVMPLPTKARAGIVVNKEVGAPNDEESVDDEEETVEEEVLVDDDGNSIEEEILEEDVIVDDDGNEIIEEEISSSESSTSEDTQELLAENKVILNSQRSISAASSVTSSSHEPNPFMPPKSAIAPKQLKAPSSISSRSSRDVTVTTRQEEKNPVTSSVISSSRSSRRSTTNSSTEDSGSTRIVYVRDPRDLDEIVAKCFDGATNVRIVDDPNPQADDDSDYVPSKQMLIFLCLLVVLVALSIILGTAIYFK